MNWNDIYSKIKQSLKGLALIQNTLMFFVTLIKDSFLDLVFIPFIAHLNYRFKWVFPIRIFPVSVVVVCATWQRTLKKNYMKKLQKLHLKNSKCINFGTKSTHFEKYFRARNFSKCVVTAGLYFNFYISKPISIKLAKKAYLSQGLFILLKWKQNTYSSLY